MLHHRAIPAPARAAALRARQGAGLPTKPAAQPRVPSIFPRRDHALASYRRRTRPHPRLCSCRPASRAAVEAERSALVDSVSAPLPPPPLPGERRLPPGRGSAHRGRLLRASPPHAARPSHVEWASHQKAPLRANRGAPMYRTRFRERRALPCLLLYTWCTVGAFAGVCAKSLRHAQHCNVPHK